MATDYPVTMAIRALRQHKVEFTPHLYTWEPRGGTRASAEHLGVDEHQVVKTLIFEDEAKQPAVHPHARRSRSVGEESRAAARTQERGAVRARGGGPAFGLPGGRHFAVRAQARACRSAARRPSRDLPLIYINGGARGFLVGINPADLVRVLEPTHGGSRYCLIGLTA